MLSFKPTFSLYPFAFIKKLFSSSSLSAIRVVSPVCLRLLIFLLAILIPACASSNLAFHMMYSAHKLNKQGDNIQPWRTPLEYVSILKSRDVTLPTKVHLSSQSYGFSSSHVWVWELDHKESWALKNCCFWTVVLEKTVESPLEYTEIQPVHPKGNQSWIFTRRTDVEAETPILWPPDAKNWLIGKDLDAGKDWRQEEKGMTEDEMVGWYH